MLQHPLPFPWKCNNCGATALHPTKIDHQVVVGRGKQKRKVFVPDCPVLKCGMCNGLVFQNSSHERIKKQIELTTGLRQINSSQDE